MVKKSKTLCNGCYNDFYNNAIPKGCWNYDSAKVVKKCFIHLSMVPPWSVKPEVTLDCCRRQRYVSVDPDHPQVTKDKTHKQKYDGRNYE